MATKQAAESARTQLAERLRRRRWVNGVGVERRKGGFGVVVLTRGRPSLGRVPALVDGVPVRVREIGEVQALGQGQRAG